MQYIYARVSTDAQDNENQLAVLRKQYPEATVIEETASGAKDRPELTKLVETLVAGDTLIVSALDRLGRRLADLIVLLGEFQERGVVFISLRENIDYSTAAGRMVAQIFCAFAEFERNLISERTKAALAAKKAQGVQLGRPNKFSTALKNTVFKLRAEGYQVPTIVERTGISTGYVEKLLRTQPDKLVRYKQLVPCTFGRHPPTCKCAMTGIIGET